MESKGNNIHNIEEEKERLKHSIISSGSENLNIINSLSIEDNSIENSNVSIYSPELESKFQKHSSMKLNLKNIFDGNLLENKRNKVHLNWEYVIILKNPKWYKLKNSKVTPDEAENLYRNAFKRKKNKDPIIEALQYDEEINAFNNAFEFLEDFQEANISSPGKLLVKGSSDNKEDQINEINFLKAPSDFSTLILRSIFYKLVAHLGLTVKKVLSDNNKYIYYLITADEEVIENEAERIKFNKQLEISLSDLISIFPCDLKLRPLHLLESPYPCIDTLYEKVRLFFHKAFGTCEYSEKKRYKHKAIGISLLQWKAYETFLEYIKKGIKLIPGNIMRQEKIYIFWKLVKQSINEVNKTLKNEDKLKNLWDYLNISKPIAPYAEFRRSSRKDEFHELWRKHSIGYNREKSLFRSMERIRLINSYIETAIDIHLLEAKGFIVAHFPTQTYSEFESHLLTQKSEHSNIIRTIFTDCDNNIIKQQPLKQCWKTNIWNQQIPLSKIRNYFGEKIALYFEFLRLSQKSLIVPSVLGIILFIIEVSLSFYSSTVLISVIIYSGIMTSYSIGFLEYWKRRESSLAIKWGQTKFEKLEIPRGHFNGKKRRNPITDELDEVHLENWKRWKYFIISYLVTSVFICLVISIVVGLFFIKQTYRNNYASTACSFMNALQIQVFNKIYKKAAIYLTNLENHKTQSNHENSLILKTFAFQFVNSFNSLIYIAYIKGYTEGCFDISNDGERNTDCMNELFYQLLIIFSVNYASNIIEIGMPYIKYQYNKYKDSRNPYQVFSQNNEHSPAGESDLESFSNTNQETRRNIIKNANEKTMDEDFKLKQYIRTQFFKEYYLTRERDDTIYDYMELAMQFGYLTLFAAAFPLSPFLSFIGLWLEMLTDKYKLLELIRRPIPLATKNIGTWKTIFSFISIIAIFSNTAIFCYTSPTFRYWNELKQYQHIFFGIIVVGLLIIRDQIRSWVPDTPKSYEIIQQRHEYIISRILRGTVDEEIEGKIEYSEDGVFYKSKSDVFIK